MAEGVAGGVEVHEPIKLTWERLSGPYLIIGLA